MVQDWYKDAVFYEVFVRAFADSNQDGIGDLEGLTRKLDYVQDLGIDVLWLLPIAPSPLRDDGYDVSDYCGIHPDYGTLEDLQELVIQAHRRGLRVVAELVPNHTSDQHPWFLASRNPEHPEHGKYRDWYVWSPTDTHYADARIIFLDYESSNWTYDPVRKEYYWHRFFRHQPDLNYDNPQVQQAMLRVAQFWIDQGVDGMRVDATPYLYEREGTSCENLPETHAYLKRLRRFVDAYAPGTMLLSEANQWPEDVLPYFGAGDEFHMNFHFPLMPRIFMALAKASREPIEAVLGRTPKLPESCQWGTFLRCHDELTLEMVTPEERQFMWQVYAPDRRMRSNLGIRRRLAPLLDNDMQRIQVANSILLSLVGSPFLYYGDEIGMGDNIWLEDRDGLRTPMQWDSTANAGFSSADSERLYAPVISSGAFGYEHVNVQRQLDQSHSLLNWTKRMLRLRRRHPAFARGEVRLLTPETPAVLAYLRKHAQETLLVANNLSPDVQEVPLDLSAYSNWHLVDLLGQEDLVPISEKLYHLRLEGHGYRWFQLQPAGAQSGDS